MDHHISQMICLISNDSEQITTKQTCCIFPTSKFGLVFNSSTSFSFLSFIHTVHYVFIATAKIPLPLFFSESNWYMNCVDTVATFNHQSLCNISRWKASSLATWWLTYFLPVVFIKFFLALNPIQWGSCHFCWSLVYSVTVSKLVLFGATYDDHFPPDTWMMNESFQKQIQYMISTSNKWN